MVRSSPLLLVVGGYRGVPLPLRGAPLRGGPWLVLVCALVAGWRATFGGIVALAEGLDLGCVLLFVAGGVVRWDMGSLSVLGGLFRCRIRGACRSLWWARVLALGVLRGVGAPLLVRDSRVGHLAGVVSSGTSGVVGLLLPLRVRTPNV